MIAFPCPTPYSSKKLGTKQFKGMLPIIAVIVVDKFHTEFLLLITPVSL